MNEHSSLFFGLLLGAALSPLACGSDNDAPNPTGNNSNSGGSTSNAGSTSSAGNAGSTNMPTAGAANGGTASGGTASGGAGGAGDGSDWIEGDVVGIAGVHGAFAFSDGVSTWTLTVPMTGEVCLQGQGALAGATYENWGAGLGLQFSVGNAMGMIESPFDAAALGIAGYSFTITGAPATGVRPGVTQVDEPGLAFQANAFVNGVDSAGDIKADGVNTIYFSDLQQPSWSGLPGFGVDGGSYTFDATSVHGVQWQIVTNQALPVDYDFCISGFTWVDEAGEPISGGVTETDAGATEPDAG